MKTLHFLLLIVVLIFASCRCNTLGDCEPEIASLRIQAVKDGEILLKGSNALVKEQDITFHNINEQILDESIFIDTFSGVFHTLLRKDERYFLQLGSYLSDTVFAELRIESEFLSCCNDIETDFVQLGGEIICSADCDDVIVLEL